MLDALKNLGNIGEMLKQARQMQDKIKSMQEQLASKIVSADAGAGMVEATVNGRSELVKLKIDKTKIDVSDTDMLEDMIISAVAAAQTKAKAMAEDELNRMAGEMGIPPGMLPM